MNFFEKVFEKNKNENNSEHAINKNIDINDFIEIIETCSYGYVIYSICKNVVENIEKISQDEFGEINFIDSQNNLKEFIIKELKNELNKNEYKVDGVEKFRDKMDVIIENVVEECLKNIYHYNNEINSLLVGKWVFVQNFFRRLIITRYENIPIVFRELVYNVGYKVFDILIQFTNKICKYHCILCKIDNNICYFYSLKDDIKSLFGINELMFKIGGRKNGGRKKDERKNYDNISDISDINEFNFLIILSLFNAKDISRGEEIVLRDIFEKVIKNYKPSETPYHTIRIKNVSYGPEIVSEPMYYEKIIKEIIDEFFTDIINNAYLINVFSRKSDDDREYYPAYTPKLKNVWEGEYVNFEDVIDNALGEKHTLFAFFNLEALENRNCVFVVSNNFDKYIEAKLDKKIEVYSKDDVKIEKEILKERLENVMKKYFIKRPNSVYYNIKTGERIENLKMYKLIFVKKGYEMLKKVLNNSGFFDALKNE